MVDAVLGGISLGLVLALLIGPVFFMLIDTSIKRGFRPALYLALGVVVCDAFFILVTYFSSRAISFMQEYQTEIGIGGGVLLIAFGIYNIFHKPRIYAEDIEISGNKTSFMIDAGKGFMLNLLNPFVLIFWLGVAGAVAAGKKFSEDHIVTFFAFTLITVFITDLLKAWLASKLKAVLKPGFLLWLNRISGAGLILFGLRLLYRIFAENAV